MIIQTKKTPKYLRAAALLLCALMLVTLIACTADMDVGNNTPLANTFMDHVLQNDYAAAYDLVKTNVTNADFQAYWIGIRETVAQAESYEMEQIGWQINKSNGETYYTSAYQVYPDNGRTVLLRVVTVEGTEGIAGIHFSDVTAFMEKADAVTPVAGVILLIFSLLMLAFVIWMFVDCLRRKMKKGHKILWAILIFGGIALTFTVGQTSGFNFKIGLMLQTSSITADPGLQAFVTKLAIPLGAILYGCLRKRFTLEAEAEAETESETEPVRSPEEGNEQ